MVPKTGSMYAKDRMTSAFESGENILAHQLNQYYNHIMLDPAYERVHGLRIGVAESLGKQWPSSRVLRDRGTSCHTVRVSPSRVGTSRRLCAIDRFARSK